MIHCHMAFLTKVETTPIVTTTSFATYDRSFVGLLACICGLLMYVSIVSYGACLIIGALWMKKGTAKRAHSIMNQIFAQA